MPYDNSGRARAAASTRTRVLAAAQELFVTGGFAATTVHAIARAADVSEETIYKTFGSKAAVLKASYDIALAGDDQDLPVSQHPEVLAVLEADTPEASALEYAGLARLIAERTDPLLRVLLRSRGSDRALAEFAATIDRERLFGARRFVGHWESRGWLRSDLTTERASDIVWVLNSPEPRWLLHDQGWSRVEVAQWLGDAIRRTVLR